MNKRLSRRDLLKASGAVSTSLILENCSRKKRAESVYINTLPVKTTAIYGKSIQSPSPGIVDKVTELGMRRGNVFRWVNRLANYNKFKGQYTQFLIEHAVEKNMKVTSLTEVPLTLSYYPENIQAELVPIESYFFILPEGKIHYHKQDESFFYGQLTIDNTTYFVPNLKYQINTNNPVELYTANYNFSSYMVDPDNENFIQYQNAGEVIVLAR